MAEEINITIDKESFKAQYKEFRTGNTGYGLYTKVTINGIPHQVSLNIIRIKNKGPNKDLFKT